LPIKKQWQLGFNKHDVFGYHNNVSMYNMRVWVSLTHEEKKSTVM